MPTLFRFLAVMGLLAATVYGGMVALALFVQPEQREMSVTIPPSKFSR